MTHLRKLTAVLLAAIMVFALAACGQKDDTAAVVSAVAEKDSRVRLLTVENGGPAAAREHGLAAADP